MFICRYVCHSDDVYVVIGGLGGFGLELIDWLILRGARKVVINSRRGISNGYQSTRIRCVFFLFIPKKKLSINHLTVNILFRISEHGQVTRQIL